MTSSQEFRLEDGTTVRFLVAGEGRPTLEEDSPDGIGPLVPVARRGQAVAADVLRNTLKPLGPLVRQLKALGHDVTLTPATA